MEFGSRGCVDKVKLCEYVCIHRQAHAEQVNVDLDSGQEISGNVVLQEGILVYIWWDMV